VLYQTIFRHLSTSFYLDCSITLLPTHWSLHIFFLKGSIYSKKIEGSDGGSASDFDNKSPQIPLFSVKDCCQFWSTSSHCFYAS
jgi:hypothetical protein